ncbi:hypothetical protein AYO21_00080 [Fonsecaea monophora]|uniref:Aminoglycoside phosphotransferase domain-containing protein n=1 Tax=Fonsecaea monophora TaxID=254056 RepID=A0A177FP09_9EURO|nr:hypothetical protein AYO21_00080 [Fonsecaea monophora]OAG45446.1 hypothetical protein AYO21_00080 [Fonsecaea monophora]
MHARFNKGFWAIGSRWLLRDETNDHTRGNEYMTWKFLKEQPGLNIPLVEEMIPLSKPQDPLQFTLVSRAQGKMLSSVWAKLSPEQKAGYRDQMVTILKQLRQFTAPYPQKVNGDKLHDALIAACPGCDPPSCFKVGRTDEEWLEDISETVRGGLSYIWRTKDEKVIEEKLQKLEDDFPRGGPYVLTHGDLALCNIMVKDDKIIAIIDWEKSGYFPWWAEKYFSRSWTLDDQRELFEGVWERVAPELADGPAWEALVDPVHKIRRAVLNCKTTHKPPLPPLYRGPFCKCRPWGQLLRSRDRGAENVHEVVEWRNSCTPGSSSTGGLDRTETE